MSYYKPRVNVIIDGVLIIPPEQVKRDLFSYQFQSADGKKYIYLDNPVDLTEWLVPDLHRLAETIGLSDYKKLKKVELQNLLRQHLSFSKDESRGSKEVGGGAAGGHARRHSTRRSNRRTRKIHHT